MEAKISEQNLTDYALNELGPEERIYVETMLGASEEAREEVYKMIDLAMMLDAGFERQQNREPAVLSAEQRRALLGLRGPNIFLRNSVVALAAAACLAFAVVHQSAWIPRLHLPRAITASHPSGQTGMRASTDDRKTDFISQILHVGQIKDDPLLRKWFSSLPGMTRPSHSMDLEFTLESSQLDFTP